MDERPLTPEEFDALPTDEWCRRLPEMLARTRARTARLLAEAPAESARCPECGDLLSLVGTPVLVDGEFCGELGVAYCRGCPYSRMPVAGEVFWNRPGDPARG